jgi:hypothetical protein
MCWVVREWKIDQTRTGRTRNQFIETIPGNKLLLDHYLDGAIEAEADAILTEKMCTS